MYRVLVLHRDGERRGHMVEHIDGVPGYKAVPFDDVDAVPDRYHFRAEFVAGFVHTDQTPDYDRIVNLFPLTPLVSSNAERPWRMHPFIRGIRYGAFMLLHFDVARDALRDILDNALEEHRQRLQGVDVEAVERAERARILQSLARNGWVIYKAADELGMDRKALARRIRHLRIVLPPE